MFRIVSGVFMGYVAMFVSIFFGFSGLYLALGSDRTFQAGSYEVTPLWLAGSILISFIAAWVGGKVCAVITKKTAAVIALAAVVLALDLLSLIAVDVSRLTVRSGEASLQEAIVNAKEPTWVLMLLPFIAVVGVLVGGRMRKKTG